jgi:diguanylate cyclase (GGDEF)-like protein
VNAQQLTDQKQPVRIGVLAFRGHDVALKRWEPTAKYLSSELSRYQFQIIPLTNDDINSFVNNGQIDFVLTNPASYVGLEMQYGVRRLATLLSNANGGRYTRFGAVVITRSDNNIYNFQDLRGKSFMAVHQNAFGGWWMAQRELLRNGTDPVKDLKSIRFVGFPQDQIVYAVRDGKIDAGTVRSGVLEDMAANGHIRLEDFRVINSQKSLYFHNHHSTELYPEWPLAAVRHVPIDLAQDVSLTLLRMPETSSPNIHAQIKGWTAPLDYQPVHALMQELQVGPYEHMGKVSLATIVTSYTGWIIALMVLIVVLMSSSFFVIGLNRRLIYANKQLEREVGVHTELENRLRHQALHDPLTDLPNRNLLMDRLHQAIFTTNRDRVGFAIAMIDLNKFKKVNDSLGHECGDRVLKQVAERFQEYIRKSDTLARFGGDEFILLMQRLDKLDPIVELAKKCKQSLHEPFSISGKQFRLSASIGIAVFPLHGKTADELIRHADLAMYKAKLKGGGITIYNHNMIEQEHSESYREEIV